MTEDNFDTYKSKYLKVFEDSFKMEYPEAVFKKNIVMSDNYIFIGDDNVVAIVTLVNYKDKEINKFFKEDELLFLCNLAVNKAGTGLGKKIVETIVNNSSFPTYLHPWKDELIPYYKNMGFKTVYNKKEDMILQIYRK